MLRISKCNYETAILSIDFNRNPRVLEIRYQKNNKHEVIDEIQLINDVTLQCFIN